MAVREGRWDCQYCGEKGIQGRNKACPNCGRSRPEGTKFYRPKDGDEEVANEKLAQQAKIGPDWICEFCGSSNPANVDICQACNAPREGVSPQQEVKEYAVGAAPISGDMDLDKPVERPSTTPKPRSIKGPAIGIAGAIGAGVIVLICIALAILVFGSRNAEATVSGFSWQRTIVVESFQTIVEEDWDIPAGGRVISQQEEIRDYQQVIDHYETRTRQFSERVQVGERTYVCGQRDLGNGFFEDVECSEPVYETQSRTEPYQEPIYRQEPIYDTKFTYEIDKWIPDRTEAAGNSDHLAIWPETNLGSDEREGERTEIYKIYFTDPDGKEFEYETTESEWRSFELNQGVTLKLDTLGNNVEGVET
jgi:hypothetical protein